MKVLFSPEYRGHVFLGINEENTQLMDVMVCDTMALIGMLELRLGIHAEEHPGHYRTVKYFEAMTDYMKKHPKNILSESFKLSSLGADADTLGAIVGSIAEAIWGIPEEIKQAILLYLPDEMKEVVSEFYEQIKE